MNQWIRYLKTLLQNENETPWAIPVFGAVLLSVFANLAYDFFKEFGGIIAAAILLSLFFIAGIALVALFEYQRQRRRQSLKPIDKPRPAKHKGLIILVSSAPVVKKAIAYHLPELEYCWLITTPQTAVLGAEIQKEFLDRVKCVPRGIENELDSEGCYHLVAAIYQEAPRLGLSPSSIIADITGGTKPMTTALVLACLNGEPPLDLEHVPTHYEMKDGKRVYTEPLDPIQIEIKAYRHSRIE